MPRITTAMKNKREHNVPSFHYITTERSQVLEEKIESLLERLFKTPEFADCFLLEVKLHANQKVEIFIDSDTGVTFEKCRLISRHMEQHIDENGWLGEKYTLEVSSPGVSRPLVFPRQYPKHMGRTLEITLQQGDVKKGKLIQVDDKILTIEEEVKRKEGKKNVKEIVQTIIPFDEIKKAVVKISY